MSDHQETRAAVPASPGDSGPHTLTAAVRCPVCGTVPYATPEEADKRAEQHTRVTRHPTTVVAEPQPPAPRGELERAEDELTASGTDPDVWIMTEFSSQHDD